MSFRAYGEYKDSGVEWLDEIPSSWQVRELKYACSVQPSNVDKKSVDGQQTVRLCNYTDVYYHDAITSDMDLMTATATDEQIQKFTLRAGDVIITKDSETADDIAVAAYVPEDLPGVICGYHLAMIRPRTGALGAFVKRLFDSNYIKSTVATLANGLTRVGLGHAAISGLEVPIPPLSEQLAIAAFLDSETAKIDSLVAEQRRLIELLKEKRQAVISHAVTKGLDPTVPMKNSGIQWLGEVPEHWRVLAYRHLVTRVVVGIAEAATHAYAEEGVPIVRSTNIKTGTIDQSKMLYIKPEFAAKLESKALHAGDIVVTRTGANVGVSAVVPGSLHMSQCFTLVISSPKPESNPEYYNYFINSRPGRLYIDLTAWGSGQPNISVPIIQRMHTVAPPREEQDEIVAYVERASGQYDGLIDEAERAIALLQERRTALISAAVTGKIDVRGLKPEVESNAMRIA